MSFLRKPHYLGQQAWETVRPTLWHKCAFCIIYEGGVGRDLVSGRVIRSSAISAKATKYGMGVDHSNRVVTNLNPLRPGTGGFTLLTFANPSIAAGRQAAICQRVGNENRHIEIRFNSSSTGGDLSGGVTFFARHSVPGHTVHASSGGIDGNFHSYVGRRSVSGLTMDLWLDGARKATAAHAAASDVSSSAALCLGGLTDSTGIPYTEDKLIDIGWNRALSDAELRFISADPFAMIRTRPRAYGFVPSSAPATNTVAAGATAVLQRPAVARTASLDAVLQRQAIAKVASLDAVLQKAYAVTGSLDAVLQTTATESVALSASLRQAKTAAVALAAALQDTSTVSTGARAAVAASQDLAAALSAALQQTNTASVGVTALVTGGSTLVVAQLSAALRSAKSLSATLSAAVQTARFGVVGARAALAAADSVTAAVDAALQRAASVALGVSVAVQGAGVVSVGASAVIGDLYTAPPRRTITVAARPGAPIIPARNRGVIIP